MFGKMTENYQKGQLESYAGNHLKRCPICSSKEPEWKATHRDEYDDRILELACKDCGCVIGLSYMDIKGIKDSAVPGMLKAVGNYDYLMRSASGKKKDVPYIEIIKAGKNEEAFGYEGKRMPLDEMKDLFW